MKLARATKRSIESPRASDVEAEWPQVLLAALPLQRVIERLFPGRAVTLLSQNGNACALLLELFPADLPRLQRRRIPAGARRLSASAPLDSAKGVFLWPIGRSIPGGEPDDETIVVHGAGTLSGSYRRAEANVLRSHAAAALEAPSRACMQPAQAPAFEVDLSLEARRPDGAIDALWIPSHPRLVSRAIERIQSPEGGALASVYLARAAGGVVIFVEEGVLPPIPLARPLRRRGSALLPCNAEPTPKVSDERLRRALRLADGDLAVASPRGVGAAVSRIRRADVVPLSAAFQVAAAVNAEPLSVRTEDWSRPFAAVLGRPLSNADDVLQPLMRELAPTPAPSVAQSGGLLRRMQRKLLEGRVRAAERSAMGTDNPEQTQSVPQRLRSWFARRRAPRPTEALTHGSPIPRRRQSRPGLLSRLFGRRSSAPAPLRKRIPAPASDRESVGRRFSRAVARALFDRFRFLRERALGRHGARLAEVLNLFRQGRLEEALKRAVPLADGMSGAEPTAGLPGAPPPPRDALDFRLTDLLLKKGALATLAVGPSVFDELRQSYRRAAERLLAQGRHRAAAYVYAVLLDDVRAAGDSLSRGGFHREAAVVFLDKAGDRRRAARELAACGDYHRAADLAESSGEFESAAGYLVRAGDAEAERACLIRWARKLAHDGRYLQAGRIHEERLSDFASALAEFRSGMGDLSQDSHLASLTAVMRCELRLGHSVDVVSEARKAYELLSHRGESRRLVTDFEMLASLGPQIESVRVMPGVGLDLARSLDSLVRRSLAAAAVGLARLSARARADEVTAAFQQIASARLDRLLGADVRQAGRALPVPSRRPAARGLPQVRSSGDVVHALCASRRGALLAGASDHCVHIFATAENWAHRRLEGSGYSVLGCASDPEGRFAVALTAEGALLSFEVESGRRLGLLLPAVTSLRTVAADIAAGVAWAGDREGRLFGLRLPHLETTVEIPVGAPVTCLAAEPQGRLLAVGTDSLVGLYDITDRPPRSVRTIGFERPLAVAFSPTRRAICIGGSRAAVFSWPDAEAGPAAQLTETPLDGSSGWTRAVAFSLDGHQVACGGFDRSVRIFETETGKEIATHRLHQAEILSLCYLPDGSIASSDARGGAVVVHPDGPRVVKIIELAR
jgi:tetratricopeptide (TPR) repeat protein